MQRIVYFIFLFSAFCVCAQDSNNDTKYLEDQFYLGVSYNVLRKIPNNINQRNLSYGLQAGFIKDMPINSFRTMALGVGLGYASNSYYTNLKAIKTNIKITYAPLTDDIDFSRSKIETHALEMPIQLRWRQSTPDNHKFLRIYGGVKLGYVFAARSKFVSEEEKTFFTNSDIQRFQYGLQFNIGYNTWNVNMYYGLNSIYKDTILTTEGTALTMKPIHIGFIFYIL